MERYDGCCGGYLKFEESLSCRIFEVEKEELFEEDWIPRCLLVSVLARLSSPLLSSTAKAFGHYLPYDIWTHLSLFIGRCRPNEALISIWRSSAERKIYEKREYGAKVAEHKNNCEHAQEEQKSFSFTQCSGTGNRAGRKQKLTIKYPTNGTRHSIKNAQPFLNKLEDVTIKYDANSLGTSVDSVTETESVSEPQDSHGRLKRSLGREGICGLLSSCLTTDVRHRAYRQKYNVELGEDRITGYYSQTTNALGRQ
ncbi:hypothetical protein CSKR_103691 [Clonorchis sinensis]|uniref:Uncharacterized protein n=1 Tax=Clonorchis sinensis TaxID=79923 RepID=A0A3R7D7R6_CLOSI|nr:hypothetical protein CSKR_103691 [Clonorchis sinensis]